MRELSETVVVRFKPQVWDEAITCTMGKGIVQSQHRLTCSVCRVPLMEGEEFLQQVTPRGNWDVFWIHETCGELV